MSKILALCNALLLGSLPYTAFAANCNVTAKTTNVNINQNSGPVEVEFFSCKNKVYFRHEFLSSILNGTHDYPTLVLDGHPDVYIKLPYGIRIGATWPHGGQFSFFTKATDYYPMAQVHDGKTYIESMPLSSFGNLSTFPPGTYRTSVTFSAIEY